MMRSLVSTGVSRLQHRSEPGVHFSRWRSTPRPKRFIQRQTAARCRPSARDTSATLPWCWTSNASSCSREGPGDGGRRPAGAAAGAGAGGAALARVAGEAPAPGTATAWGRSRGAMGRSPADSRAAAPMTFQARAHSAASCRRTAPGTRRCPGPSSRPASARESGGQRPEILEPLAQRRQHHRRRPQTAQQVRPQRPRQAGIDRAVGGRQHPHVQIRRGRVPPSGTSCRSCRNRSSFACTSGRHLADLVEKQRPPVGPFDQPRLARPGGGMRPRRGSRTARSPPARAGSAAQLSGHELARAAAAPRAPPARTPPCPPRSRPPAGSPRHRRPSGAASGSPGPARARWWSPAPGDRCPPPPGPAGWRGDQPPQERVFSHEKWRPFGQGHRASHPLRAEEGAILRPQILQQQALGRALQPRVPPRHQRVVQRPAVPVDRVPLPRRPPAEQQLVGQGEETPRSAARRRWPRPPREEQHRDGRFVRLPEGRPDSGQRPFSAFLHPAPTIAARLDNRAQASPIGRRPETAAHKNAHRLLAKPVGRDKLQSCVALFAWPGQRSCCSPPGPDTLSVR